MSDLGLLVAAVLMASAGEAEAQEVLPFSATPTAPAYAASASPTPVLLGPGPNRSPMRVGATFLAMPLGRAQGTNPASQVSASAAFAYGIGATFTYDIITGISVGIAPQILWNVKAAREPGMGATEYDLLARLAYTQPLTHTLAIYAEALPGYSIISLPSQLADVAGTHASNPTGLVLAFGGGATMGLGERYFVNCGIGFQLGRQKGSRSGADFDDHTTFVRIAIGGGVRL